MNKILLRTCWITTVVSPVVLSISCSEKNTSLRDYNAKDDLFNLSEYRGSLLDAKIKYWIDGDTPAVEILSQKGNPAIASKNIRITGIDTPELHLYPSGKKTTGEEFKWASKAKKFGSNLLKKGTNIKIFTDGTSSYNRLVGSIFYGGNSQNLLGYKNYSVDILKNGLAMPFVQSATDAYLKTNVLNITGLAMADSYNWALENKKGIFSTDLSFLKTHGKTNDNALLWRDGPKGPFDETNIYDIWDKISRK